MVSSTSWQSVGFVYGVAVALSLSVTHLVSAAELMVNFDGILSADIVEQVSGRDIREHGSHVWMSKKGLVVETQSVPGTRPRIIYLYNYQDNRSWIVSPEGKRYCELSSEEKDSDFNGGILSTKPCLGLDKSKLNEMEWNNQVVTVWQCQKQQRDIGKHYYSEKYGVVVREEGTDGIIRELRNLGSVNAKRLHEVAEGISSDFRPVKNYRSVTVREFFFAKRPLDKYLE